MPAPWTRWQPVCWSIGIERATKILGLLTGASKSYAATIRLGQTTSTEDAEGQLLQEISAEHLTEATIAAAITGLRGDIMQVPSAVSAVKVDGQRAYKLAREGKVVELAARPVRIDRFEMLALRRRSGGCVDLDVVVDCSSGTYVRALARDLGDALAVGGHLTALRRTRVGRFGLDQARSLDELAERPQLSFTLDEACLQVFPRRDLAAEEADAAANGRALTAGRHRRRLRRAGRRRPGDRAAPRRRPEDEVSRRNPAGHTVIRSRRQGLFMGRLDARPAPARPG